MWWFSLPFIFFKFRQCKNVNITNFVYYGKTRLKWLKCFKNLNKFTWNYFEGISVCCSRTKPQILCCQTQSFLLIKYSVSLFTEEYYKGTNEDYEVLVNVEGCVFNGALGLSAYLMATKVVTQGLFLCASFVMIQQLWDMEMENELLTVILACEGKLSPREPHKEEKP